jgi:hypothetical protein
MKLNLKNPMEKIAEKFQQISEISSNKYINRNVDISDDDVSRGSMLKFNSILQRIEEIAKKGNGSCFIILDKTYDLFKTQELRSRVYSEKEVVSLLKMQGFQVIKSIDNVIAQTYKIMWNYKSIDSHEIIDMNI